MRNIDVEAAVDIYYSTFVLETPDIRRMFRCSYWMAAKLKHIAADFTLARGEPLPSLNEISTRTAFEAWGYDIADLEERAKKLAALRKRQEAAGKREEGVANR